MKGLFKILAVAAGVLALVSCGSSKALSSSTTVQTGFMCTHLMGDGSLIVQSVAVGASREAAMDNALRGVVDAMLFSGIPGDVQNRIQSQEPLVKNSADVEANKTYFNNFFAQGKYRQFATMVMNNPPVYIKSGGGYKVTANLIVKKNQLRHELEDNHVIKSLQNVF